METLLNDEGVSTHQEQRLSLISSIIFIKNKIRKIRLIGAAIASLFKYQILTRVFIPPSVWGE